MPSASPESVRTQSEERCDHHPSNSTASVRTLDNACLECGSAYRLNPCHMDNHAFCSARCRARWHREHPGQRRLDFDPAAVPLPKLNSTAPRERKASLQRKAIAILERLRRGSVDNLELPRIGGARYGARLGEIREHLRWRHGKPDSWEPIECVENKATGYALYTLLDAE